MKKIKSYCFIFIVLFLSVFISCNDGVANNQGQGISNYPDWVCPSWNDNKSLICLGTSEWLDWQGEQGKLLWDYVPDNAIPDDYEGKFRLHIDGQNVGIQFNDVDSTVVSAIFNWIGSIEENMYNGRIYIPQADIESSYDYDCYCKKKGSDGAVQSNKAHVKLTRMRDDNGADIGFNYLLTINKKILINVDVKLSVNYGMLKLNENHAWLNFHPVGRNKTYVNFYAESGEYIHFDRFWDLRGLDGTGNIPIVNDDRIEKYIYYCFEGVSLRYIDDATQTIQLNLLDAEKSDFADYLEVVRTGDKAKLTYYKIVEGNPIIVKSYEDLDCVENILSDS